MHFKYHYFLMTNIKYGLLCLQMSEELKNWILDIKIRCICLFQKYFDACDRSDDDKISKEEYLIAMGQIPDKDHKYVTLRLFI